MKSYETLYLSLAAYAASNQVIIQTLNDWFLGKAAFPNAEMVGIKAVRIFEPINDVSIYVTEDQEFILVIQGSRDVANEAEVLYFETFNHISLFIICTRQYGRFHLTTEALYEKIRVSTFRSDAAFSTTAED